MDERLRRFHIRTGVRDALSRHGIGHNSPLRAQLEANATIAAGDSSRVIMKSGNSLDAEIENWLSSPRPARRELPTHGGQERHREPTQELCRHSRGQSAGHGVNRFAPEVRMSAD